MGVLIPRCFFVAVVGAREGDADPLGPSTIALSRAFGVTYIEAVNKPRGFSIMALVR
jgi:hypothetical protein